jgi:hypothetical protein
MEEFLENIQKSREVIETMFSVWSLPRRLARESLQTRCGRFEYLLA